jgi:hypothetical protein
MVKATLRSWTNPARSAAYCSPSGIPRRLHPGGPGGPRRRRRHSRNAKPSGPACHQWAHLRPAKPRRALLFKAETQPETGRPLRQDRRQLTRLRLPRIHPPVGQALCPHRLIVETALSDLQALVRSLSFNPVNETIVTVYSARPPAMKVSLQGLRLPSPRERGPAAFLNQAVKAQKRLSVVGRPILAITPGLVGEDQLHGLISSRSSPRPASS